jgi:hypothetical protein
LWEKSGRDTTQTQDRTSTTFWLIIFGVAIAIGFVFVTRNKGEKERERAISTGRRVIVRSYRGNQSDSDAAFQEDAVAMAARNYFPTSQSWAPGQWEAGAFVIAFLLCFILIGFVVFVYMLIVKPDGTLTVTYELREAAVQEKEVEEKTCPKCAERIKAAALVCHFCRYEFPPVALSSNPFNEKTPDGRSPVKGLETVDAPRTGTA